MLPLANSLILPESASSPQLQKSFGSLNSSYHRSYGRNSIDLPKIVSFHKRAVLSQSHKK